MAAQFCGIGESTLRSWLQRGRAVAEARDAHPAGHVYCPACDLDRTEDLDAEEQANYRELLRYEKELARPRSPEGPEPTRSYAVMDRCGRCGSEERPAEWQVPEREARYLAFLEAITQAETAAEVAAVTHWRAAFPHDWRAARDYLVRSKPDRWAATTRVQISQEEADRRIESAVEQVLVAAGVDTDLLGEDDLLAGDLSPEDSALDGGSLDLDLDLDLGDDGG